MGFIVDFFKKTIFKLDNISKSIKLNQNQIQNIKISETVEKSSSLNNIDNLLKKWVYSTNHKYIGILYLIFGLLMGIVGATFSLMIRLELLTPGHVFF
jgi:hypothetical protein